MGGTEVKNTFFIVLSGVVGAEISNVLGLNLSTWNLIQFIGLLTFLVLIFSVLMDFVVDKAFKK